MTKTKPYAKWGKDAQKRWIELANHFGRELMLAARNYACDQIPAGASRQEKAAAKKGALDAIYGTLMLLDGVVGEPIDEQHQVEYALIARVRDDKGETLEEIELAPGGDGLCMGHHDWVKEPEPGQTKPAKKGSGDVWKCRFYMNESSELMQFFQSSVTKSKSFSVLSKWFYVLLAENGCGLVPGKAVIPDRLPANATRADIFLEGEGGSIAYFHKARQLGVFQSSPNDRWLVDVNETPVEKVLAMAQELEPALVGKFLKAYEPFRPKTPKKPMGEKKR